MKNAIDELNRCKLDEDSPWGSLSVTEKYILALILQVNQYRKSENKSGRTDNRKANNRNVNNKKENRRDKIGKLDADMVGGIPKWKFEPKVAKPGNTMVCN